MTTIAIIGFGGAGVACLKAMHRYATSHKHQVHVDIFQPQTGTARGVAYQDDFDYICLNHHYDFISIDVSEPFAFAEYLKQFHQNYLEQFKGYQPRWLFNRFMQYQLDLMSANNQYLKFSQINENVNNIAKVKNGYKINDGSKLYNVVILATGHTQPNNYYNLSHEQYINNPYPMKYKLAPINPYEDVGIIGTGLTAVDAVVSLHHMNHKGKLYLASRSGYFSNKRTLPKQHICKYFTEEFILNLTGRHKLFKIIEAFDKEILLTHGYGLKYIMRNNTTFEDLSWQNIFYACNKTVELAWSILSAREKDIFFKRYHRLWLDRRVGILPHNYDLVISLQKSGQLEFINNLQEITGTFVLKTPKIEKKIAYVINATGSPRGLTEKNAPLIYTMVKNNLASYSTYGGINVDFNTSELLNSRGNQLSNLYAIGHITTGTFLYTPIMEHIVRHADKIAKHTFVKITKSGSLYETYREF